MNYKPITSNIASKNVHTTDHYFFRFSGEGFECASDSTNLIPAEMGFSGQGGGPLRLIQKALARYAHKNEKGELLFNTFVDCWCLLKIRQQ